MSAFSHFSHRNFTARMNNCSCGFATRHVLMFERHMKRCLNNRSGTSSVGQIPESHSGTMPRPLPAPTVCRNYKCGKCSFVSNQAKVFLFHQRHDHGENIAVYGCDKCEYASRHKNKVIRHKKLVHKIVSLPDDILALEDPSPSPFQASASCAAADAGERVEDDADDSEHEGPLVIADVDQSPEEKLEPGNQPACHSGDGGNSVDGASKLKQPVAETARFNGFLSTNLLSTGLGMMTSTPKLSLLKLNNSKVVFRCKFCRYSNPHKWKIASHMRTSHSKKTIFKCPVCTFVTERKIDWCAHKSTHSGKMIFSCTECAYQTTMKRNYERHQERHLVNGPRRCSLCTYSSTGEGAIQRHMAEYHPPSPGKGIVHEDKNVKCAAEDYKVVPEDRMVESSSNCSFGSTTTVCSSFPAINSDFDVKLINSSSSTAIQPEGPAQEVQCGTCGLLFKSESKLRVHLIAHSSTSVWTCSLCPLRYKRPADLNRHMKRKHGATLMKNGKNALTPVPIQPDEQPLNLSLKTSPSFEPVLLLPDPPIMAGFQDLPLDLSTKCRPRITNSVILSNFKCTHCSYMSKRQSDLRRHMLVHCNEKRYRCLDCGKGYKLQFDLNRHMNRVHRQGQATATHFSSTSPVFYGPTATSPEQFGGNSNLIVALQQVDTRRNSDLQCATQAYDSDRSLNGISIPSIPSPLRQMDLELAAVVGCHSQPQVENLDIKHQDVKKSLNLIGFKCKQCLYIGNSLQDLDLHTKLHTIEKPACCHFCSHVAPKKSNMKHHLVTQHGREILSESNLRELMDRIYSSDDGNAKESSDDDSDVAENLQLRFDNCVDYNMNVEMGSNSTRHGKETNPFVSDTGKSLERTAKSTRCTQCSFVCDAPSKMRCHMEIHENLRRFMCTHCGKRSNFLSDIRKHMKKKHPGVELTIQELSEEEAKQTLPDYKRSQMLESCSLTKVSPSIKDISSIAGQTFQKEEPMDMESIAEQYANEVTAMFYGNLGSGGRVDMDDMSSRSASQSGYSESIDSKLPDDKKFGRPSRASLTNRYRPFKCSECGRRSNWRWDLNKHIRASHPNAHLIQLSEEVARATFSEVLKRDTKEWRSPEQEQQHDEPTWKYKPFMCDSCGHRSNWKCDVTKHIKALHPAAHVIMMNEEHAKDTLAEYDEKHAKLLKLEGTREKMMIEDAGARRASDRASHTVDAHKTKKFKCSACPYRSNFRSDVGRHIRHKHDKNACKIVVMPELEAAATLTEYMDTWARKKFVPSPSKRRHSGLLASPPGEKETIGSSTISSSSNKPSGRRLWKCSSCSYKDLSKDAIVQHWQQQHQSEKDAEPAVAETECVGMSDEESAVIKEMGSSIIGGIELPSIENIQDQTFSLIRNQSLNSNPSPAKQLLCSKCPYQTNTAELLNIHTSYHTPQAGNKYKCRHCPYYVCAPRLLNQHVLLHIKDLKVDTTDHLNLVSGSSENQLISAGSRNNGTGRTTYLCARCPYVSCNRNDYLYHRQFHRSRPCAPFKCDHCQYWVSQKRLLSQHAKVHERKYQEKHMRYTITDRKIAGLAPTTEDDDMKVAENTEMGPGGDAPEISSETCHVEDFNTNPDEDSESDAQTRDTDVEMEIALDENESCDSRKESKKYFCNRCLFVASSQANLASHMLLHDIPQKYACRLCDYSTHNQQLYTQHKKLHQSSKSPKPEEDSTRLNRDGAVAMVESLYDDVKKTYTCDRCPYSNARKDHLQCHMRFHLVKSELQCQHCDYSVSRVHLLNQHMKIHGVDVKSSKTPVSSPQESPRRPSKSSHLVSNQSGHQINSSSDLAEIQESFDGTFDESTLEGEHNLKEIFMQNLNLRSSNQSHNCDLPRYNSASCNPPEMFSNEATGFTSVSNLIHHAA